MKKPVSITKDDLTCINHSLFNSKMFSFSIEKLKEDIFSDDDAAKLEYYFNDLQINADQFNVEYLGYLMGEIEIDTLDMFVHYINEYLKQNKI